MRGILYNKINEDGKNDGKKESKFKKFFNKAVENTKEILKVAVISFAILCGPNSIKADVSPPSISATDTGRKFEVSTYANDAGGSLTGSVNPISGFEPFRLTVGGIWINNSSYPIGSINFDPNIRLFDGTLVLNYFGNVAGTNMASYLYITQGVGGSVHFDIRKTTVHVATLLDGAISYPLYDLLYARWLNGLRWNIGNFQLSVKNINYFAASKTPDTSWAFDYAPRYQGLMVDFGYTDGINRILVGIDSDKINPTLWAKYSREVYNGKDLLVGVNLQAGMGGFNVFGSRSSPFFPQSNYFVLFGINVNFPDSNYSANIERRNVSQPSSDKQFVYETGDITQEQREYIDRAKKNILNSKSFGDLIESYKGSSKEELLTAANYIASVIGRGGYDYGAYNDLREFKIFSPNVKALTERNYNDILYFLREYLKYYQENGTYEGMPEGLKRGVAICAGIHEFVAEFLRANGMNAYTMTVTTKSSPHIVAVAFYDGKASIIDYGMRYTTRGNLDDVLNIYSKEKGVPILQTQIFGRGGKYLGTYITSQGKIVQNATLSDGNGWLDTMLGQDNRGSKGKITPIHTEIYTEIDRRDYGDREGLQKKTAPAVPVAPTPSMPSEVKPEEKQDTTQPKFMPGSEIDTKKFEKTGAKKPDAEIAQKNNWPDEEPKKSELPVSIDSALKKVQGEIIDFLNYKRLPVPSKVIVRITVDEKEGKITQAQVTSGVDDNETKKIIENKIKRARFVPIPTGGKKIIDYTLVFVSASNVEF